MPDSLKILILFPDTKGFWSKVPTTTLLNLFLIMASIHGGVLP